MENMLDQITNQAFPENPKSKEAVDKFNEKFQCRRSLSIIKLQGIGISLVDFQPTEICYISFEGMIILQEYCQFKHGSI